MEPHYVSRVVVTLTVFHVLWNHVEHVEHFTRRVKCPRVTAVYRRSRPG